MCRVLKPGGKAVILEFSNPTKTPVNNYITLFSLYYSLFGKYIARNKAAYTYLPSSVKMFPQGQAMCDILHKTGFQAVTCKTLSFGICSVYSATR